MNNGSFTLKSENIVYYCTDENYLMPTAVSASSLLRNLPENHNVKVLIFIDGQLSRKSEYCLRRFRILNGWNNIIDVHYLESLSSIYFTSGYLSSTAYQRIIVPELIKNRTSKCLYLDCDTLVKDNILQLFDIDLDDKVFGACKNRKYPYVSDIGALDYCYKDFDFNEDDPFFNSGVLLINLPRFIETDIPAKVYDFCLRYGNKINFGDQEALNAVAKDNWLAISARWNWTETKKNGASNVDDCESSDLQIAIRHYVGSMKPWDTGLFSRSVLNYWQEIWMSKFYRLGTFLTQLLRFYIKNIVRKFTK